MEPPERRKGPVLRCYFKYEQNSPKDSYWYVVLRLWDAIEEKYSYHPIGRNPLPLGGIYRISYTNSYGQIQEKIVESEGLYCGLPVWDVLDRCKRYKAKEMEDTGIYLRLKELEPNPNLLQYQYPLITSTTFFESNCRIREIKNHPQYGSSNPHDQTIYLSTAEPRPPERNQWRRIF